MQQRFGTVFWQLTLWALITIGCSRIAATYRVFSATKDEPTHIVCGLEWLDRGTYQNETQHPPLARLLMAIGPYLAGARSHSIPQGNGINDLQGEGQALLGSGQYWRMLALARLGVLPFFVLSCLVLWTWTAHLYGKPSAMIAVVLFSNIPPVLGHAGLATTDLAATGTLLAALWAFTRYVEAPNWPQTVILGLGLAFAVLTKFSNIPFFAASVGAFFAVRTMLRRLRRTPVVIQTAIGTRWVQVAVCVGILFLVSWSAYRFSRDPILVADRDFHNPARTEVLQRIPRALTAGIGAQILSIPVPGGQIARGIASVFLHNVAGHNAYLLGEFRATGWWYFFPVVLAVKTPISFLLLAGISAGMLCKRIWTGGMTTYQIAPVAMAIAILLFAMTSRIDLGVRHILIVYPLLASVAGYGVAYTWARRTQSFYVLGGLALLTVVSSVRAHPDYLAYFNEFAGSQPERVLIDSDLDWGQDLSRLKLRLNQLGVRTAAVSVFGMFPPDRSEVSPFDIEDFVSCERPPQWVAVSVRDWALLRTDNGAARAALFACLNSREPEERIGRSILLYRFNSPAETRLSHANLGALPPFPPLENVRFYR